MKISSSDKDSHGKILGSWRKTTKKSNIYPPEITFTKQGIYHAKIDENQKVHPIWDAGEFYLISENTIKISTSNDEEILYKFIIEDDRLSFETKEGCQFSYYKI